MEDLQEVAEQIFVTVLGLDPDGRAAYLQNVCRDSPEVRARVEQMLKEDELAGNFLERPLFDSPRLDDVHTSRRSDGAGPQPYTPQFKTGEVICDRFAVIRFIAKGGMGEVYEVEDRQLRGVRVALKTILSHYAADPLMQERFEREVLNAREVVHPNLCPIYDIFHWMRPEGRLTFLTMKLLAGETLTARLERTGPLPGFEAAQVIKQVGAGLAAAHRAGILHRDIKAANIIVDGFGDNVYACVTDFGLARAAMSETTALTVGGVAGTPGYMAPELFYGRPPSKASDVFAFGVVAYQVLTGELPQLSLNPSAEGSVTAVTRSLPQPWRQLVSGCLQPYEDRRYEDIPSALELLAEAPTTRTNAARTAPLLTRRRMIALAAAGCAAVAGGAWLERDRLIDWLEPLPPKRFVALMAWPAGESQSVVLTILDSIGNRLARAEASVKDLLIISFNDVPGGANALKSPTSSVTALGANLVLAASLHTEPSRLKLALQVLDASTQKKLRAIEVRCAADQMTSLIEEGSKAALALLDLPSQAVAMNDQEELKRISPETFRDFSDAEQLVNQPNDAGLTDAIMKYQQALADDPRFALGYARLAKAYIRLYLAKGDAVNIGLAERNAALSLRLNSNSASGLFSEGLALLYSGKIDDAIRNFDKSLHIDAGNPEIPIFTARALIGHGQFTEAEQVYRDAIKERPNYWPAYVELGWVLSKQAKYQAAAEAYDTAAVVAPNVALPLANLGTLYLELGKRDEAITALNASLARSPNDEALLALGDLAFSDGKYTAALDYYRRATVLVPKNHLAWRNVGDCYAVLGQPAQVLKCYAKAAEIVADFVATNPESGSSWAQLAFYHAKIHDTVHAAIDLANAKAHVAEKDVESKFMIVQALAVLGKKQEALDLLLTCIDLGLAPIAVDLALDLGALRKDPRYLSHLQKQQARNSLKAS